MNRMRSRPDFGRIAATTLETLAWVGLATGVVAILDSVADAGRARQHLSDRSSGGRDPSRPGRRSRRRCTRRARPQLLLHQAAPPADDRRLGQRRGAWGAAARGAGGRASRAPGRGGEAAEAELRAEQASSAGARGDDARRCGDGAARRHGRPGRRRSRPAWRRRGKGELRLGASAAPRAKDGEISLRLPDRGPTRSGSTRPSSATWTEADLNRIATPLARLLDVAAEREAAAARGAEAEAARQADAAKTVDPPRGLTRPALAADRDPDRRGRACARRERAPRTGSR